MYLMSVASVCVGYHEVNINQSQNEMTHNLGDLPTGPNNLWSGTKLEFKSIDA